MIFFVLRVLGDLAALGMPPEIKDKAALRTWLQELADIAERATRRTESPLDDQVLRAFAAVVDSEETWNTVYGIIELIASGERKEYVAQLQQTREVADKAEVDPITIIAIINAVIEVIKIWREQRS